MRARLLRLRGLVQRYRVDRRLPPSVLALYRQAGASTIRSAGQHASAAVRRPLGSTSPRARLAGRSVSVAGELDVSLHELGHRHARAVVDSLRRNGCDPFLVTTRSDQLVFGLPLGQRSDALAALDQHLVGPGWYLGWADGARSGTVEVSRAPANRHVRRARSWNVYRAHAVGERAVGVDQGAEITFWSEGTSGQLELVGTRGHHRFDRRSPATVERVFGYEYPGNAAFPVTADMERMTDPIDVVYTWVDGADPDWQDSFRSSAATEGRSIEERALDPARYTSHDELRYSLRSVWMFAGWVRQIYVVTSGQVPEWLADDDRVRVVPHAEILPAEALPTFNSHAIEAALHRIEGLSEHFIYFNDDVFLGRSVRPESFFTANGLPYYFASGARVPGVDDDSAEAVDTAARRGRELLASRFGVMAMDKPVHAPYPLRRSVIDHIDAEFSTSIEATRSSRFRSPSDLSVAAAFAQHVAVATGRGVVGQIDALYVHLESTRLASTLKRVLAGRDVDTFCINETTVEPADPEAAQALLADFFEAYFPVAAPWERDR